MHVFASHANYDIETSYMISLFHCVIWAVIVTADLFVFLPGPAEHAAVPPRGEVIVLRFWQWGAHLSRQDLAV